MNARIPLPEKRNKNKGKFIFDQIYNMKLIIIRRKSEDNLKRFE